MIVKSITDGLVSSGIDGPPVTLQNVKLSPEAYDRLHAWKVRLRRERPGKHVSMADVIEDLIRCHPLLLPDNIRRPMPTGLH